VTNNQNFAVFCHICHKPIRLEQAVSDSEGHAVHPECYTRIVHDEVQSEDEHPDRAMGAASFG